MLLSTDTPESVMKPTAAEIEIGISRSHRPKTPPAHAKGTLEKINMASKAERYVTTVISG